MKFRSLLFALMTLSVFTATAQLAQNNAQTYYKKFKVFFADDICTELLPEYQAMNDDELLQVMKERMGEEVPQQLADIALKVKNDNWEKREKEFRVTTVKPYSNPNNWKYYLNVRKYSELQNPTGITGNGGYVLIFVGEELSEDLILECGYVSENQAYTWMSRDLSSGLNVINMPKYDNEDESTMLFLGYNVDTDTTATSKKLSDYPEIPIHIEGGYVNGYFDLSRHTDADWREMLENNFKHYSVQVLGERVMYHMELANIKRACPNTITDAIRWWDQCVTWQHELMGVDKYYDRWNDLIMAKDGYENMFMYATESYTYYEYYTIPDILPWAKIDENPGNMWGPAHEIGHVNQGAISIVSCTEVSNNLFANAHLFRAGKTTSRGLGVSKCVEDFTNRIPFPQRGDVFSKTRMYHQLYLYFHAAGKDTTFYPRLFDALRNDPMQQGETDRNWTYHTFGVDNQLKFAEKCCEIAQMDLSEFFEAWGLFEPMNDAYVGDYNNFIVNMTAEEAESSRRKMQQYEKKGGHLMFIEDRIKPSPRTDGVAGNRLDYSNETPVGKMGDTGQWEDYIDESVKATGYYFIEKTNSIEILKSENAGGALGFKLYDAQSGELLSFSNTYTISIPAYAYNREYKVVAAQADGSDAELMNAADSDDEHMQKATLEALLSQVKIMLQKTTKTGNEIGRFYADAVAGLKEMYNKALKAVENGDTSEHSYAEWNAIISEEVARLKSTPGARATLKAGDVYNFINAEYRTYLTDDEMGMKCVAGSGSDISRRWLIDAVAYDGTFVIKNKNGEYVNDIELNTGAMCSGSGYESAVAFKVAYNDNSTLYITTAEGEEMHLTANENGDIVGSKSLIDGSLWNVVRVEKGETAIEEIEAENGDGTVYDLLGRKVTEPAKGIYIKNGKVTVIK